MPGYLLDNSCFSSKIAKTTLRDFLTLHFCNSKKKYFSNILFPIMGSEHIQKDKFFNTKFLTKHLVTGGDTLYKERMYFDSLMERFHALRDQYITSNGFFKSSTWQLGNLQSYMNIVLDFDWHCQGISPDVMEELYSHFWYWFEGEAIYDAELPTPNTIVMTGRGIQMWYALESCAVDLGMLVKQLTGILLERWGNFFSSYGLLENLRPDYSASMRPNGLFRLPGSYNSKIKKFGSFVIVHHDVWEIHELQDALGAPDIRSASADKPTGPAGDHMGKCKKSGGKKKKRKPVASRVRKLILLARIRAENGTYLGCRDMLCHIIYCVARFCGFGDENSYKIAEYVNRLFPQPLDVAEFRASLSSSRKYVYRYSNKTVVAKLGITQEESRLTGFYPWSQEEQEKLERKAKKEVRDRQILELCSSGDYSKKDIAAMVGCCIKTIYNVLEKYSGTGHGKDGHPAEGMDVGRMPGDNTGSRAVPGARGGWKGFVSSLQKPMPMGEFISFVSELLDKIAARREARERPFWCRIPVAPMLG